MSRVKSRVKAAEAIVDGALYYYKESQIKDTSGAVSVVETMLDALGGLDLGGKVGRWLGKVRHALRNEDTEALAGLHASSPGHHDPGMHLCLSFFCEALKFLGFLWIDTDPPSAGGLGGLHALSRWRIERAFVKLKMLSEIMPSDDDEPESPDDPDWLKLQFRVTRQLADEARKGRAG